MLFNFCRWIVETSFNGMVNTEHFLYVLMVGISYQVSLGWSHWDHKR